MIIMAIDPGTRCSGFCIVDSENMQPKGFGKEINDYLSRILRLGVYDAVVIERVASMGLPVGAEVFETCEWVGRFSQIAEDKGFPVHYVYRKDEKMTICGSMKATDATIRRALIDRYAQHDKRTGKGTKGNPDWFYGFKKDIWAAFAVAETWKEMEG